MSNSLRTSRETKAYLLPYSITTGRIKLFVHILAQILCLHLILANISWDNCYYIPIAIFLGMVFGDITGGMAHYTLDNYGIIDAVTAKMPGPPFIAQYVAHHDYPNDILSYDFWTTNSDGLYATSIVLSIVYFIFQFSSTMVSYLSFLAPITPSFITAIYSPEWTSKSIALLVFWMTGLFYNAFTNQFHKWSHMLNPPPIVAFLQKNGFLLSFAEHRRHHVDPKIGYCLTTGWCNFFLEKIYFWRILDYLMILILGKNRVEESRKVENRINFVKGLIEKNK